VPTEETLLGAFFERQKPRKVIASLRRCEARRPDRRPRRESEQGAKALEAGERTADGMTTDSALTEAAAR